METRDALLIYGKNQRIYVTQELQFDRKHDFILAYMIFGLLGTHFSSTTKSCTPP